MAHTILMALAPVFFVMLLGDGAGKLGIANNREVGSLNALVMDIALPASLFAATASAARSEMPAQIPLFAVLGVVMMAVHAAWFVLMRALKAPRNADLSLQALTIAFPNMAGVALPIARAVLGPGGTLPVAVALAAGSPLVSPLTLILVDLDAAKRAGQGLSARLVAVALGRAAAKPIVLAPALGVLAALAGLKPGPTAEACLALIGQSAAGAALFLTGLAISAQPFRLDGKIIAATAMADILRPLAAAALVLVLPLPWETAKVAILLSAIPSGFFGILFAVDTRFDAATTGAMVLAGTLFSIVTLAVAIAVLFPPLP